MIGTDRRIFEDGSDVRHRIRSYGKLVDELHVIVYSTKAHKTPAEEQLSTNTYAYGTNSANRWFYAWNAIIIGKKLPKPDLVTAQDPADTGIAALCLARHFGAKLELQVHGDLLGDEFGRESLLNRIRALITQYTLPRADGIRVVSKRSWDNIVSALGERIQGKRHTLLPVFVDGSLFEQSPITYDLHKEFSQFSYIILMVTRIEREKNIELGIDALARVLKEIPGAGLVIVGDGSFRPKLEDYAEERGVRESVVFLGWWNGLPTLYKTADVYLLTSNHEGNPRTPIEATYAGCPVVMTDVGTAGDIFVDGEGALVAPVHNATALAAHLIRLAKDPTLRYRLSGHAYASVQTHTPTDGQKYLEALHHSWEKTLNM
jgi:glycosyltransferase involved in cell wall biosynthesis